MQENVLLVCSVIKTVFGIFCQKIVDAVFYIVAMVKKNRTKKGVLVFVCIFDK